MSAHVVQVILSAMDGKDDHVRPRSVLLGILILTAAAHSSPSAAQPVGAKSEALPQTTVDGRFARYLELPNGDIDGIVLEDGNVARFAPFNRALHPAPFRAGDSVRVTGDVARGLSGTYLVHAFIMRISVPTMRRVVSPAPPAGSASNGSRLHRTGRGAKGSLKDGTQTPRAAGKPGGSSTDRSTKVDDVHLVESPSAGRKGRLEAIESKASEATTGKGKSGNYSQWSRAQETAGP